VAVVCSLLSFALLSLLHIILVGVLVGWLPFTMRSSRQASSSSLNNEPYQLPTSNINTNASASAARSSNNGSRSRWQITLYISIVVILIVVFVIREQMRPLTVTRPQPKPQTLYTIDEVTDAEWMPVLRHGSIYAIVPFNPYGLSEKVNASNMTDGNGGFAASLANV
jgi:hypothetical protein